MEIADWGSLLTPSNDRWWGTTAQLEPVLGPQWVQGTCRQCDWCCLQHFGDHQVGTDASRTDSPKYKDIRYKIYILQLVWRRETGRSMDWHSTAKERCGYSRLAINWCLLSWPYQTLSKHWKFSLFCKNDHTEGGFSATESAKETNSK